jgi:TonB family protein
VYSVSLVEAAEVAPEPELEEPEEPEPVEEEPEEVPQLEPEPEEPAPQPAEERRGPERNRDPSLPIATEGEPFEFPWYLERLVQKVGRNWKPAARELSATIYFRIARTGRLTEVKVFEESGNFLFDQAAVRAVRASDPMPPLPQEYTGDYLGVYFDFDTHVDPVD